MKPPVLIVENDPATRLLLRVFAERAGAEVDAVSSGLDAQTLLDRVPYAAIILDLHLDVASGHHVLAHLQTFTPSQLARTIVVSAAGTNELSSIQRAYPAVQTIQKPFELEMLGNSLAPLMASCPPYVQGVEDRFCRQSVRHGAKAGVVVLAQGGQQLVPFLTFGLTPEQIEKFLPLTASSPYPIAQAFRQARPVWIASLRAAADAYPLVAPVWKENHSHAVAAVPLLNDGNAIGSVGWSFYDARAFGEVEKRGLLGLAEELAMSLVHKEEHRTAG